MRTAKLLITTLCFSVIAGIAGANSLTDNPPTIFYPEGHYLEGNPRTVTRDIFGYSYQTHMFRGYFANVYLGGDGLPPYCGNTQKYYDALVLYGYAASAEEAEAMLSAEWYWDLRDIQLSMRWNDVWLSNRDRGDDNLGTEPDGKLDRHYGFPSYYDSEAVLTQFQYEKFDAEVDGEIKTIHSYYYSKIIAVPSSAVLVDGIWYTEDGVELGPVSNGSFARVKTFYYEFLDNGKRCYGQQGPRKHCDNVRPDDHCGTRNFSWKKYGNHYSYAAHGHKGGNNGGGNSRR